MGSYHLFIHQNRLYFPLILMLGATVYCVLCTVYCVQCVLCTVCTVYCVYRVLCTVYCVPCTVYRVLCTVYCVTCTVYRVLCTVLYCVRLFSRPSSLKFSPLYHL